MDIKQLAAKLSCVPVENLESIAKRMTSYNQATYTAQIAHELVQQRLTQAKLNYEQFTLTFPYRLIGEHKILIGVSPELIVPDMRKNALELYIKNVKHQMDGIKGIIHFLPFQRNGTTIRRQLEHALPIAFVNLPYDQKSMERRFRQYVLE